MKINKKVLGICAGVVGVGALVPTLAVTLSSCSNNPANGVFYSAFNSPYKELDMYAETLDNTGMWFEGSNNHEVTWNPSTNSIVVPSSGSQSGGSSAAGPSARNAAVSPQENTVTVKSFKQMADLINGSMKNYVKALAGLDTIKNLVNDNSTVLFVKNDSLTWNENPTAEQKNDANLFQIEQPILYSQIYSSPTVEECPGFGFKFPTPVTSDANSLFDDWFEIGAKAQGDSKNANVVTRLTKAWSGTADFVFYLYDSKNMSLPAQENLINYIYSQKASDGFRPAQLLKDNAKVKHVIPLDIEWMYDGVWDQVGSFIIDYLFAQIFSHVNADGGIDKFYNTNFAGSSNGANSTDTSETDKTNFNKVLQIAKSAKWTPTKSEKHLQNIRPYKEPAAGEPSTLAASNPEKNKFMTTMFNTTGHAFSLGIAPDFIVRQSSQKLQQHQNIAAYLSPMSPLFDNSGSKVATKGQFVDNVSGPPFAQFLKANGVYALADNQDSFGDELPPLKPQTGDSNSNQPQTQSAQFSSIDVELQHEETGTDESILHLIKPVYTQRNDTTDTQYVTDFQLWDSLNKSLVNLQTWVSNQKYLSWAK